MKSREIRRSAALAACILSAVSMLSAQEDPLVGTWSLRVAKKNGQPTNSNTLIFEPLPNGEKHRSFGVNVQGVKTGSSFTAYYDDGKDYPIAGNPDVDAVEIRRLDSHTTERINKKGGKVLTTARRVVSKDGRTLTITTTGTNARGEPVDMVTVYDKQ